MNTKTALVLYTLLIISLFISEIFPPSSIFTTLILFSPLAFLDEKFLGIKRFIKGFIYGILPSVIYFPFLDLNQLFTSLSINVFFLAFGEEVFFRGYLFNTFNIKNIHMKNIFISLLFTLPHLIQIQTLDRFLVFFPSIVFGYLYIYSKTVWSPAVFHYFSNMFYINYLSKVFSF